MNDKDIERQKSSADPVGNRRMLIGAAIGLFIFAILVIPSLIPVPIEFGLIAVLAEWWCMWKAWRLPYT